MILTDSGTNFEQAPVGSHIARCIKLIDIGTQTGEYQGQKLVKRQLVITWELCNELMSSGDSEGKPFCVSSFYTASLNEKANLRKHLMNWRGRDFTPEELKGFNLKNVLDKGCMLSVVHNEKEKAVVSGVMALPKGTSLTERVNDLVYFSLDEFDQKVFDKISDGFKKKITVSPEYLKLGSQSEDEPNCGQFDEDMVF